jgi:ABC-type amino acid transport substrate-binding protein
MLNSPPLALLASDNRTRIGSDPDIARLLAGSLGLKLKLVPTAWEDWPLGIASGRYDVALVNIAVTEQRKEKFDFATYRVDSLAFSVKSTSEIQSIKSAEDLAGKKVIVGSGPIRSASCWAGTKRTKRRDANLRCRSISTTMPRAISIFSPAGRMCSLARSRFRL